MRNLLVTAMMIAMTLPMIACDKYDDFEAMSYVNQAVTNDINASIKAIYPDARVVDIDRELRTYEVDIVDNNIKREVYLDLSMKWLRTETEIRHTEIPTAVTDRVTTKYSGWYIDSAKLIDTPQGSYYQIELDKGEREKQVKIDASGNVL